MRNYEKNELMKKWQVLGLSLMMISENQEDFFTIIREEFGYIWNGEGWNKEVKYQ